MRGRAMVSVRLIAAVVLATVSSFYFHVHYGRGWAVRYVEAQAALGRLNEIAREPYPWGVYVAALATAFVPTLFQVFLFVLVRDRLPGASGVVKGLWFGVFLLAIGDNLLRMPIMNVVVGNPIDVMLVQSAEYWVIGLLKGLLIGVLTPAQLAWPLRRAAKAAKIAEG